MTPTPPLATKLGDWEYLDSGSGSPTLVILPGGGSTARSMFALNAALEPDCRVVSIGLPTKVLPHEKVLQGIEVIFRTLNLTQAVVLGSSLGGMIAPAFAKRYPERVSGLILANTGFYCGARAKLVPAAYRAFALFPPSAFRRLVISKKTRLVKGSKDAEFWSKFYDEELSQPDAGQRVKSHFILGAQFCLASPLNHPLPIPVQIIGAEDDRGFTDRERAFLQTLYPQATVKIFPAPTGHMSFLTRADEYTAIVRHFIESVTGS